MPAGSEFSIFNEWTVLAFSVSFVISAGILVVYWRKCVRPRNKRGEPSTPTASDSESPDRVRVVRKTAPLGDDWGRVVALGIDLGSYETKAWLYDGQLKLLEACRSMVTMYKEGFHFGDVEFAKDYAENTFFSLPQDMTMGADVRLICGDVSITPYQATGALIQYLMSKVPIPASSRHRHELPPLAAIGVPPYLNSFAKDLYLSALAGGVSRVFIFKQSAALLAALLRHRRYEMTSKSTRPSRHVVFVDIGRSGISAAFCDVRETAASIRRETFRFEGLQEMERQMVADLSKSLTEEQASDPYVVSSIVEAAAEIRYDFASTPAYLLPNAKRVSRSRVTEDLTVEMDRERFYEIVECATKDAQEVADEIASWIQLEQCAGSVDLVLTGNGTKLRELRTIFEGAARWKSVLKEKISIAQGLALLAAMRHPKFADQRYDIDPLYEQLTLDETGLRPTVEEAAPGSILSPLLRGSSSHLSRSSRRRSTQDTFARTSTSAMGSTVLLQDSSGYLQGK